jgi:hypothetical protein
MIHNSSTDPVLIKKISLKIWTLRDEIEARLQEKLTAAPETEINIEEFRNDFLKSGSNPNNLVALKSGEALDTSEDAMARAMAGEDVEIPEDAPPTGTTAPETDDTPQEDPNLISIVFTPSIVPPEKIYTGKTVLSEISMEKMFFFCNKSFTEGQSVVLQFCIPKIFLMNADILYCRPYNMHSRIISKNKYDYRVLIKFTFLKDGERALLRQFIQSIEPDLSKLSKNDKPAKGGSDLGEFDDLGL